MQTAKAGEFPVVALQAGLCAEEVDELARQARRCADVGNRALAFYLAEMETRGLCQVLGYPSVARYAVGALGMSRRRARELVRVGIALRDLKLVDAQARVGEEFAIGVMDRQALLHPG